MVNPHIKVLQEYLWAKHRSSAYSPPSSPLPAALTGPLTVTTKGRVYPACLWCSLQLDALVFLWISFRCFTATLVDKNCNKIHVRHTEHYAEKYSAAFIIVILNGVLHIAVLGPLVFANTGTAFDANTLLKWLNACAWLMTMSDRQDHCTWIGKRNMEPNRVSMYRPRQPKEVDIRWKQSICLSSGSFVSILCLCPRCKVKF